MPLHITKFEHMYLKAEFQT